MIIFIAKIELLWSIKSITYKLWNELSILLFFIVCFCDVESIGRSSPTDERIAQVCQPFSEDSMQPCVTIPRGVSSPVSM